MNNFKEVNGQFPIVSSDTKGSDSSSPDQPPREFAVLDTLRQLHPNFQAAVLKGERLEGEAFSREHLSELFGLSELRDVRFGDQKDQGQLDEVEGWQRRTRSSYDSAKTWVGYISPDATPHLGDWAERNYHTGLDRFTEETVVIESPDAKWLLDLHIDGSHTLKCIYMYAKDRNFVQDSNGSIRFDSRGRMLAATRETLGNVTL